MLRPPFCTCRKQFPSIIPTQYVELERAKCEVEHESAKCKVELGSCAEG